MDWTKKKRTNTRKIHAQKFLKFGEKNKLTFSSNTPNCKQEKYRENQAYCVVQLKYKKKILMIKYKRNGK